MSDYFSTITVCAYEIRKVRKKKLPCLSPLFLASQVKVKIDWILTGKCTKTFICIGIFKCNNHFEPVVKRNLPFMKWHTGKNRLGSGRIQILVVHFVAAAAKCRLCYVWLCDVPAWSSGEWSFYCAWCRKEVRLERIGSRSGPSGQEWQGIDFFRKPSSIVEDATFSIKTLTH